MQLLILIICDMNVHACSRECTHNIFTNDREQSTDAINNVNRMHICMKASTRARGKSDMYCQHLGLV